MLFLRPFSSFSDRSLVNGLLNALPPPTQVVFLVASHEPLRNWDPYTIGLAGFRFLEPLRSAPIALVSEDDEWVECVRHFIARSALIIVDLSTTTASLEIELGLIREEDACSRTLIFREQSPSPPAAPEGEWLGVLTFRRGFNVPRALLALALTAGALGAVWLSMFDQIALQPSIRVGVAIVAGMFLLHHWSVVFLQPVDHLAPGIP